MELVYVLKRGSLKYFKMRMKIDTDNKENILEALAVELTRFFYLRESTRNKEVHVTCVQHVESLDCQCLTPYHFIQNKKY